MCLFCVTNSMLREFRDSSNCVVSSTYVFLKSIMSFCRELSALSSK